MREEPAIRAGGVLAGGPGLEIGLEVRILVNDVLTEVQAAWCYSAERRTVTMASKSWQVLCDKDDEPMERRTFITE